MVKEKRWEGARGECCWPSPIDEERIRIRDRFKPRDMINCCCKSSGIIRHNCSSSRLFHPLYNMAAQKASKYVFSHVIVSPTYTLTPRPLLPASPSSSFARRKAFAIKHREAEPLTRRDLQYDLLHHIFSAQERVFTDPSPWSSLSSSSSKDERRGGTTVTFRDLYVHALMDSPRCSKALREKMQETPEFATDFAKMSLLANVGRVNTTMTCRSIHHFAPDFADHRGRITSQSFQKCVRHYVLIIPSPPCRKPTPTSKTLRG